MKLGIITDIHEDVVNLKKAISIFETLQCDEIICLGDIIGYNAFYYNYHNTRDANESINIIKSNCRIVLIGNHDLYAIGKLPENRKDFIFPIDILSREGHIHVPYKTVKNTG